MGGRATRSYEKSNLLGPHQKQGDTKNGHFRSIRYGQAKLLHTNDSPARQFGSTFPPLWKFPPFHRAENQPAKKMIIPCDSHEASLGITLPSTNLTKGGSREPVFLRDVMDSTEGYFFAVFAKEMKGHQRGTQSF